MNKVKALFLPPRVAPSGASVSAPSRQPGRLRKSLHGFTGAGGGIPRGVKSPAVSRALLAALSLSLFLAGAGASRADFVYREVNNGLGLRALFTKVINVNVVTGLVSPLFADARSSHFSVRVLRRDPMFPGDLRFYLAAEEWPGTLVAFGLFEYGKEIGRGTFGSRVPGAFSDFRSISGVSPRQEFYCGFTFLLDGEQKYGWARMKTESSHPLEPSLTVLSFGWDAGGAPVMAGVVPPSAPALSISAARELSWASQPGLQYQLQVSEDMVKWTETGEPLAGTGAVMTAAVPVQKDRGFCRLKVTGAAAP